jgi:hypothetical protein
MSKFPLCLVTSYKWGPFHKFEYILILTNETMSFSKKNFTNMLRICTSPFTIFFSNFLFPKKLNLNIFKF